MTRRKAIGTASLLLLVLALLLPAHAVLAQEEARTGLALSVVPAGPHYDRLVTGQEARLFLHLRNTGTRELTSLTLSALPPEGWAITISPDSVSTLPPGSTLTADVRVIPPTTATTGKYYSLTFVAESADIREVAIFRVRVERPAGYWRWVGGGLALATAAAFVLVYLRYGRK